MVSTTKLTLKLNYWISSRSNICVTKYESNWKYTTKSTAEPRIFLPWNLFWTTRKFTFTKQFFEVFSSEQAQAENERLKLQHQKWNEAANQLLREREREPEPNELLQRLKELDTKIQGDNNTLEKTQMFPSNPKKVSPQQVAISEFSILTPLNFHAITDRQKEYLLEMLSVSLRIVKIFHKLSTFWKTL